MSEIPTISEIRRGDDRKEKALTAWALSQERIKQAKAIFDQFKEKRFLPAYRADVDETRRDLDHAVLCDWLDFGDDVFDGVRGLAKKWCAEPSVHGGKK